jgi:hypothetical protein
MCPCACSLSEKTKKNFQKKRASLEKIKKTPPEIVYPFLIGNIALTT